MGLAKIAENKILYSALSTSPYFKHRGKWNFEYLEAAIFAVLLSFFIFSGYVLGLTIPPFDFLGPYNTDAYYWWAHGGFFSPPEWNPTLWEGMPTAVQIQNSAWYLPVGIMSLFGSYSLHSAAILAVAHVIFGSFGTYVVVRKLGQDHLVGIFALAMGVFASGYFSNAEHVDIMRAYAFTPWLILTLTTAWPWKSYFGIPLAALLFWQFFVGSYPGNIVAFLYMTAIGILVILFKKGAESWMFLASFTASILIAALLSAIKFLPYFAIADKVQTASPDVSAFNWEMVGTLLFDFVNVDLPNDASMRPFYIGAVALSLLPFADFRGNIFKIGTISLSSGLFFGLPILPWFEFIQKLPGMNLSRFSMSDFKPYVLIGILLIVSSAFGALLNKGNPNPTKNLLLKTATSIILILSMVTIGIRGPFSLTQWFGPIVLSLFSVIFIVFFVLRLTKRSIFTLAIILLTLISGTMWSQSNSWMWQTQRIPTEVSTYGGEISKFLKAADDTVGTPELSRGRRKPLPANFQVGDLYDIRSNIAAYTGQLFVSGYVNLKRNTTPEKLSATLLSKTTGPAFSEFVYSEGKVILQDSRFEFANGNFQGCELLKICQGVQVKPSGYIPGYFRFAVTSDKQYFGLLNEAYYRGWQAKVCIEDQPCIDIPTYGDPSGLVAFTIPQGKYELRIEYSTPNLKLSWGLFWLGVLLLVTVPYPMIRNRQRKHFID